MKRNRVIFKIIFILLTGLVAVSCKKKNFEDHIGPSICASDNFQYTSEPTVSSATVNLNSTPVTFSASFNEEVPWDLVIRGTVSKSYKKYSGYGRAINVSWRGNPDTLVFFQAELCEVEFKVACKESIVKTFTITTVNNFTNLDYLALNADAGSLGTLYGPPYGYGNAGTTTSIESTTPSPQGGNYIRTQGTSASPAWYFGGYDINLLSASGYSNAVGSDPSKVYFNCFVNGMGSAGSVPVIVFKEGTANRSVTIFTNGTNGWKYLSFPLSQANIVNPKNISMVSFTLNSYPVQATSGDMAIDFVIFTNNAPFISQK